MSESHSFKIYNGEDIRRFSIKCAPNNEDIFKGLVDHIKQVFGENLVPAWKDSDGDLIRITTAVEMEEAMKHLKEVDKKLYILEQTRVEEDNTEEADKKDDSDDGLYGKSFQESMKKRKAEKEAIRAKLHKKVGKPDKDFGCGLGKGCPLKKKEPIKGQPVDMTPEHGSLYEVMKVLNKSMVERKQKAEPGSKFHFLMGHLTKRDHQNYEDYIKQMAPATEVVVDKKETDSEKTEEKITTGGEEVNKDKPEVDPRLRDYLVALNYDAEHVDKAISKFGGDLLKCEDYVRRLRRALRQK